MSKRPGYISVFLDFVRNIKTNEMPKTNNKRFDLASYIKRKAEAREQVVSENKKLALQYKRLERTREKVQCKDVNFKLYYAIYVLFLSCRFEIIFKFNDFDDFLFLQLQKTKELTATLSNELDSLVSNFAS